MQKDNISTCTVKTISLIGRDAFRTTYSMESQKLYVTIPDQNSINEAKTTIKSVMGE